MAVSASGIHNCPAPVSRSITALTERDASVDAVRHRHPRHGVPWFGLATSPRPSARRSPVRMRRPLRCLPRSPTVPDPASLRRREPVALRQIRRTRVLHICLNAATPIQRPGSVPPRDRSPRSEPSDAHARKDCWPRHRYTALRGLLTSPSQPAGLLRSSRYAERVFESEWIPRCAGTSGTEQRFDDDQPQTLWPDPGWLIQLE
jgi:hypothetical protein